MTKRPCVYILASGFKKLYIGITTDLERRVAEHKEAKDPTSHTARYNIHQLVYFEQFSSIPAAISREKQLKGWLRIRKIELIVATNPQWSDLSADWGKPIPPFNGLPGEQWSQPPRIIEHDATSQKSEVPR